jgi:RNA polymerase sigma-70 factor (ECF subfamily)
VFALARSRFGKSDVAEEITQSVFVTVAAKLAGGGYAEQGKFEPWLFRVAMNRIRDEARRAKHRPRAADPETLALRTDDRAPSEGGVDSGRLREAIASLPDADREVIELRHHGRMGFKQMADLLGEPVGTLLARHHRALRKLRDLLGDSEPGGARAREVG